MADAEFRAYVASHQRRWLASAFLLTGDHHAAEDILQQALAAVWPHWRRVSDAGDPDAYVRKCLYHRFVASRRRRWRDEVAVGELPEPPELGTDVAASVAERDAIRQLLLTLPSRQRAVIVLRFFEDCSEAETAAALQCSVGTVKSQTAKALAHLRAFANEPSQHRIEDDHG